MIKIAQSCGLAALLAVSFLTANTGTADAATCMYLARDDFGRTARGLLHATVQGHSTARRMDTACDRARRECNRRLEIARRHGNAGRGATCYRVT